MGQVAQKYLDAQYEELKDSDINSDEFKDEFMTEKRLKTDIMIEWMYEIDHVDAQPYSISLLDNVSPNLIERRVLNALRTYTRKGSL
jgi:hypothetical protein